MDALKFGKAISVIAMMQMSEPRFELADAVRRAVVAENDGWVAAALGCVNDADMVVTACEFLLADCREGFIPEANDGRDVELTIGA